MVERMDAGGADPGHPWFLRMRGRVAAATGRTADAITHLRRAADTFRTAGFRHEERVAVSRWPGCSRGSERSRTPGPSCGTPPRAQRSAARRSRPGQLGRRWPVWARAPSRSSRSSRRWRRCTGRALAGAGLGRLLGLEGDADGARLRALLVEQVEELAAAVDGRDREAGQLLRDYYLRRVGSQEIVATRLHLTRATFYRRLHKGWSLLSERLTAL